MIDQKFKLPSGWIEKKLGDNDVVQLIGGGTPSRKKSEYFGQEILWLKPEEIPKNRINIISNSKEKLSKLGLEMTSSTKLIPKNSVLLTTRASLGNVAIAGNDLTTNQGIISFKCSSLILNYYLAYWLLFHQKQLISKSFGSTYDEISKTRLKELSILIPPIKEQNRIITKLNQFFSYIDLSEKSLSNARNQLIEYENSFFKSIFVGELTKKIEPSENIESLKEQFSSEHKKKNYIPDDYFKFNLELPDLPKNWMYVSLDFISEHFQSGGTPLVTDPKNFAQDGIPLLKVENIDTNGNISLLDNQLRLSANSYKKQASSIIKTDDILFNIVGPPLGVVGFVTNEFDNMNINQALVLVRTIQFYEPKLLFYCLKSPFYYNLMHHMGRGNRQDNIKSSDAKLIPIPLIPRNHQKIILEKIEQFNENQKILSEKIESSLKQLSLLRLSILKQAFEGKLVPQDPNDEPAEKLLERIKNVKSQ